jgi:hypothetical protein
MTLPSSFIHKFSNRKDVKKKSFCIIFRAFLNALCKKSYNTESKMGGAYSTVRERRDVYRVLVGKPDGKRPLERPRRRWKDSI